jgi:pyruvate dehydrogenase E1 component alpha subunit
MSDTTPNAETKRRMLEQMLLIRRFEERAAVAYGLRKFSGFCHLYIGQEAVAVGAIAALDLSRDYVLTAYRDHGHALACGLTANECMAELFGKATGCSRGKGGSMHFYGRERRMLGGNGIVGAHISVGAGVALKIRYHDEKAVVLCTFGDGAIHQGSFHETLNMAKLWGLPVIFLCENNHYAMGTSVERSSAEPDLYKLGASYGIEGRLVDGMDAVEIFETVAETRARLVEMPGPALIEARTYRYKGHSMTDPGKYRTREEIKEYRKRDPIELLKGAMVDAGELKDDEFKAWDKSIKAAVEESVAFAEDSEPPALESRFEDVFV